MSGETAILLLASKVAEHEIAVDIYLPKK